MIFIIIVIIFKREATISLRYRQLMAVIVSLVLLFDSAKQLSERAVRQQATF